MFKRQERLNWKDVRFLTKKRQVFSKWIFTIFYVKQYPNRKYHQFSFHIPLLISKRAIVRHKVKRILVQFCENLIPTLNFWGDHYKWFITISKTKLQTLIEILQKKDNSLLKEYLEKERRHTFTSFSNFLWSGSQKGKNY